MLVIRFRDFGCHDSFDVNLEFLKLKIEPSDENKRIVKDLEQGELIDAFTFIDRFGYIQRLNNLSTGCKAVLCMANSKNLVSFVECGENVVNYVINNFRHGSIMLFDESIQIEEQSDTIDVLLNGKIFKTVEELNHYLSNELILDPVCSEKIIGPKVYESTSVVPAVRIEFERGIHTFQPESSTGKSWLAEQLQNLHRMGEPVMSITYNDVLDNVVDRKLEAAEKCKIIMFDRYDMYNGEYLEKMKSLAQKSMILVDCKMGIVHLLDELSCEIQCSRDLIEVIL